MKMICGMNKHNKKVSKQLEGKKSYKPGQRKKLLRNLFAAFAALLAIGIGTLQFGWFNMNSTKISAELEVDNRPEESINRAGEKAYPYEDRIQYIPKEVPVSKYANGFFAYNQIKNVTADVKNIYSALYNASNLRRDCHPVFDNDGKATFSRKCSETDTDEKRYSEIVSYLGNKNSFLPTLSGLPQNLNNSLSCILFQNGKNPTITGIGLEAPVYENCVLNVVATKDFNKISTESVKKAVNEIETIKNTKVGSVVNGKNISICYVYQTRFNKEKGVEEERYIYYALFSQNNINYLVQFFSNYTVQNSNKTAYGMEQRSQDQCKKAFEDIVRIIIDE